MKLSLAFLLVTAVMGGCETAPITGRKQLLLVPESQAIEASNDAYKEILGPIRASGRIDEKSAMKGRVDEITARLVAQAVKYRPETVAWNWRVAVIEEPATLNAWCMAGGQMAICSGIITRLSLSDDEIAQVMGHEIAHALAKHSAERMSTAMASDAILRIGAMLLGKDDAAGQKLSDPPDHVSVRERTQPMDIGQGTHIEPGTLGVLTKVTLLLFPAP